MSYVCEWPRIWRDGQVVDSDDLKEGDIITVENFYGGVARGFHLDPTAAGDEPARFKVGKRGEGTIQLTFLPVGHEQRQWPETRNGG